MPPQNRRRSRKRYSQGTTDLVNIGIKGRKTGFIRKGVVIKDDDGLDNVDDFFDTSEEEMDPKTPKKKSQSIQSKTHDSFGKNPQSSTPAVESTPLSKSLTPIPFNLDAPETYEESAEKIITRKSAVNTEEAEEERMDTTMIGQEEEITQSEEIPSPKKKRETEKKTKQSSKTKEKKKEKATKSTNTSKRKYFQIPETRDESDEENEYQHGKRRRIKPLEYWRNEQVVYGHRESVGFATVVDVVRLPHSPAQIKPKKSTEVSSPKKLPKLSVQNKKGKKIYKDFAKTKESIESTKKIEGNGVKRFDAFTEEGFASGSLTIDPNKEIHKQSTSTDVYFVQSGVIHLSVDGTELDLNTGGQFFIPSGLKYKLSNISKRTCNLVYFLTD